MGERRTAKLNSLLKQVIDEVIRRDVRNPHINAQMTTVTGVDISKDLHHAKVYVSVIGTAEVKEQTLQALQSAAGFIATHASKKVVLRYFPALTFKIDDSVDKQMRIDAILDEIHKEQEKRTYPEEPS